MTSETASRIVYLDQKGWIDLAKIHYGAPSKEKELVERILEGSDEGKLVFPLSISHLDETMRISNARRRNQLASLMAEVSKGYAFQPYVRLVIHVEVLNIVLRKLGLPAQNVRDLVLGRGISNLIGGKPQLILKRGAKSLELPQEIKKKLSERLESTETIELALKQKRPRSLDKGMKESIEKMEKIRGELARIKDNDLRKRLFLARNLSEMVLPELAKILYENRLPADFVIKEKPTREDIYGFLDSVPTALCFLTLIYQRDQQFQRPIEMNDFNDIWFLTLAIPYSDIVVTEKMFASIAKRAKLDRKCKTVILTSISELGVYV
jgi:hypothetical protein